MSPSWLLSFMATKSRTAEAILAELGTRAHGVVDRTELLAADVTPAQITHRIKIGSLIPEFRGVYRVGHAAPSTDAHYLAAVRACGDEAYLCGAAAAHALLLVKGAPPKPEVAARTERKVEGIIPHRWRNIDPRDVTVVRFIPITTVPRTLVDLAAVLAIDALARACHEAGVRYGTTPRQVQAVLERMPNAQGRRKLWHVISGDEKVVLSKLERAFLELLRAHGFPLPETNRVASGRRVDCRWPEYRLTVELDGFRFHNSRHSWEQGFARKREARARGDDFRRFSYDDVMKHPSFVVAELAELLPRQS